MPAGILFTRLASVFTSSAKAPYMVNAITRSPGVKPFTSGPTVLMVPATSLPGENGSGGLN